MQINTQTQLHKLLFAAHLTSKPTPRRSNNERFKTKSIYISNIIAENTIQFLVDTEYAHITAI